ncbi:hypothetical protein MBT84_08445 [Streptomyces sp. MBT84]|nr:hypothetical protein [Streptomyces sp. MBT84]
MIVPAREGLRTLTFTAGRPCLTVNGWMHPHIDRLDRQTAARPSDARVPETTVPARLRFSPALRRVPGRTVERHVIYQEA